MGRLPRLDRASVALLLVAAVMFLVGLPASVDLRSLEGALVVLPSEARGVAQDASLTALVSALDPSGAERPLAGAAVRVFWRSADRYHAVGVGRSDDAGAARLAGLPRGAVWLVVDAPGYARGSTQLVLDDVERRVRVRLEPAQHLTVTVHEGDHGAPLADVTVLVMGRDALPFGALTDGSGMAHFDRLGSGPFEVRAQARGYEPAVQRDVRGDVSLTLDKMGRLDVSVTTVDGKPAADATVTIAGSALWPARRAQTDGSGHVLITGLERGIYHLKAQRGGFVSRTFVGLELERGGTTHHTLVLEAGRMITAVVTDGEDEESPVVVRNASVVLVEGGLSPFPIEGRSNVVGKVTLGPLPPGPAILAGRADGFVPRAAVAVPDSLGPKDSVRLALLRAGTLTGEVVDARGRAIDGASVEVIGTDVDGLPISETPMLTAFRDSHFAWALPGPSVLVPAGELGVTPGPVPPIPVAGLAGVSLGPASVDAAAPWVTGDDGRFSVSPIPPGRVRALVRHPGYVSAVSESVTLAPAATASVRVVLHEGGSIEGRVFSALGVPVAGARVDLTQARGTAEQSTLTAVDGTFAFASVPGEVDLSLYRPGEFERVVVRQPLRVADGESVEVELTLPEPRDPVRLTLLGGDPARPVPGAQVTAVSLDPTAPLRLSELTDEEGLLDLEDSLGRSLRLEVQADGFAPLTQRFDNVPAEIEVRLAAGVIVEGSVSAVRGHVEVEGAEVSLAFGGYRRLVQTDARGSFRFEDIAPGPATLRVSHPEYGQAERHLEVRATERPDRPLLLDPIDLQEPGSVEGTVVDGSGKPLGGVRVALGMVPSYLPAGALPPGMALSDKRGHFLITGIEPSVVTLDAHAVDLGRGRLDDVRVVSGEITRDLRIVIEPSSEVAPPPTTGGVAVTLAQTRGALFDIVFAHVAPQSEAERAGLRPGDILVTVDGVEPQTLGEARARLHGKAGTDAIVVVERAGKTLSLPVRREAVR